MAVRAALTPLQPAPDHIRLGHHAPAGFRLRAFAALAALALTTTGLTALGVLVGPDAASAADTTIAFTSPAVTVWTVPAGVTRITATVTGASGGSGDSEVNFPGTTWPMTDDGRGGAGALVAGTFAVTPGESLRLWGSTVGGAVGGRNSPGAGGSGYTAGGAGGKGDPINSLTRAGAGGGGSSAITRNDGTAILVAAGGGGGAGRGGIWLNCSAGQGGPAGLAGANATGTCAGKGAGGNASGQSSGAGSAGGSAGGASAGGGAGGGGAGYRHGGNGGTAGRVGGSGGGGGGGGDSFASGDGVIGSALAGGGGRVTLTYSPSFDTQLSFSASKPSTVVGDPIGFTAQVSSSALPAETPTGSVALYTASGGLVETAPVIDGVATFPARLFAVGSYTLTARFTADDLRFHDSAQTLTVDIAQGPTQTTLASQTTAVFGEPITATITVSPVAPAAGAPSGTVRLQTESGTPIGEAELDASGQATIEFTPAAPAGLRVLAVYVGSSEFEASASLPTDLTIEKGQSTVDLTATAVSTVWGESVSFTAGVSATAPAVGLPTGTVEFFINGASVGIGTLTDGEASWSGADLEVGSNLVTAVYNGGTTFVGSMSQPLDHLVAPCPTTTTLTSDASTTVYGQAATFTADVAASAPGAGEPTGIVHFYAGGILVDSQAVVDGSATTTLSELPVGSHLLTAVFDGDARFVGSGSMECVHAVTAAATTVALTSDVFSSVSGQDVTFTADVAVTAPGGGTPTGSVAFAIDGGDAVEVPTANGSAALSVHGLAVGQHRIVATFVADGNYSGSSASALDHEVMRAATVISVESDVNPATFGETVTLTARLTVVEPGAGTPTGDIRFLVGSVEVGTGALVDGVASVVLSTSAVGQHTVVAEFAGDAQFSGSTGEGEPLVVTRAVTTLELSSAAPHTVFGEHLGLTAALGVVAPGRGTPRGTVTFFADGTVIGTSTLNAAGTQATLTVPSALGVGAHVLRAHYAGDDSFEAAESEPIEHAVSVATATISLAAPATSLVGAEVAFTAVVVPRGASEGAPTGRVQFFADGKPVGDPVALAATLGSAHAAVSSWTAEFRTASLTLGEHEITARYLGNAGFERADSDRLVHTVIPATVATQILTALGLADTGIRGAALLELAGLLVLVGVGAGLLNLIVRRRRRVETAS
ncbi:Ig-like domain-containing protein [Glaciibacter psychrotolerans]|uniref:Bacterial Ig-like domain-containing protein n=1 Tax=Glaciibacter psychrotolerans TaxID=670054 RepID=A0A7Z0EH74_9MICO|nr:Ig-like domain-containing protein [Leifsonia psychrotolerans]NYJ21611.1 hypothetical protein [Leifsonia psychrotolerans]